MFLELVLLVATLAALWYKFIYIPLPENMAQRAFVHAVVTVDRIMGDIPNALIEKLGMHERKIHWVKFYHKFFEKIVAAAPHDQIGVYMTKYDDVPVRVYVPAPELKGNRLSNGSFIWIHGGGWCVGSTKTYDSQVYRLIEHTGMPVVSIEYTLAPQARFPALGDECERAVVVHLKKGAAALNADPTKTVIIGDSAGGNLTASVANRLKTQEYGRDIKACVLVYPALQAATFRLPSYRFVQRTGVGMLDTSITVLFHLEYFGVPTKAGYLEKVANNQHIGVDVKNNPGFKWLDETKLPKEIHHEPKDEYIPEVDQELVSKLTPIVTNPDFSPFFANSLAGQPPTAVLTMGYDVLRDEGILYAQRLQAEGVECTWLHYPEGWHSILAIPGETSDKMFADITAFVKQKLQ